jgi:hypothetical protein
MSSKEKREKEEEKETRSIDQPGQLMLTWAHEFDIDNKGKR